MAPICRKLPYCPAVFQPLCRPEKRTTNRVRLVASVERRFAEPRGAHQYAVLWTTANQKRRHSAGLCMRAKRHVELYWRTRLPPTA